MGREAEEDSILIRGGAELRESDFTEAWSFVPAFRRVKHFWLWSSFVVVVSAVLTTAGGEQDVDVLTVLPLVVVVVLQLGLLRWAPGAWAKWSLAGLGAERVGFRFDDQGFQVDSSRRQLRLDWAGISRYVETPASLLVFTRSFSPFVAPKRAFSESDLERLLALLSDRTPPKPSKTRGRKLLVLWAAALLVFLCVWQFLSMSPSP